MKKVFIYFFLIFIHFYILTRKRRMMRWDAGSVGGWMEAHNIKVMWRELGILSLLCGWFNLYFNDVNWGNYVVFNEPVYFMNGWICITCWIYKKFSKFKTKANSILKQIQQIQYLIKTSKFSTKVNSKFKQIQQLRKFSKFSKLNT